MSVNIKILSQILLISLLLGSCSGVFTFQKRHYRKGFYFHREADQFVKRSKLQTKSKTDNTKVQEVILALQSEKSTKVSKPSVRDLENISEKDLSGSHQDKSYSPLIKKIQTKWKLKPDDEKKVKLADRAKKKSRLYLLVGIALFILCFVGIGDFFPLVFLASLYFLILALINFFRRKKYMKANYVPEPDDPKSVFKTKANKAKKANRIFLILSLAFLVAGIFVSPLLIFVPIFLILAWIFSSRRRKYEILFHKNENPDEAQKQKDLKDLSDSKKASRYGWSTFVLLLLGLISLFVAFAAFIAFAFEASLLYLLLMLVGLLATFLLMISAANKGGLAKVHGERVLNRHPNEKYYSARKRALFGKRIGTLSKWTWLIALIFILLVLFIALASF